MSREGGSGGLSTRQQQTSSNLGKVWFGILQQEIEENIDFLPFVGKKKQTSGLGWVKIMGLGVICNLKDPLVVSFLKKMEGIVC